MLPLAPTEDPPLHFLWWSDAQWSLAADVATALGIIVGLLAIRFAVAQLLQARRASDEELKQSRDAAIEQALPYVVATPEPDRSFGRDVHLRVQNYGPTIATDLCLRFPERVTVQFHDHASITEDVPLPTSTLAPGQVVHRWVRLLGGRPGDQDGAFRAPVHVSYRDWRGVEHEQSYMLVSLPTPPDVEHDPAVRTADASERIAETLARWSAPDRRALITESPRASERRIWGDRPLGSPPTPTAKASEEVDPQ